jgi:hypothetical protein
MIRCKNCKFYYLVDEDEPRYCVHPLIIAAPELEEPIQKASITIVSDDIDPDDFLFQPGPEFGCVHGVDCIQQVEIKGLNTFSFLPCIRLGMARVESEPTQEELEEWDEWMDAMWYQS